MIDFHSHILPGIDDGAKTIEDSLEMLRISYENGVTTQVLTPHCYYTDEEDIKHFIQDRNQKYRELKKAVSKYDGELPKLLLGAELHLDKALRKSEIITGLAIEGTNYIMLEMPMGKWEPDIYDTIYLIGLKGLRPIMAHIDRYFYGHKKDFYNLFGLDLTYQVNCDSFIHFAMKRKVPYLFECGAIHILGSDMHNTKSRTTHMAEAVKKINKKYGEKYLDYLMKNSELVLNNEEVIIRSFEKMKFTKKITL